MIDHSWKNWDVDNIHTINSKQLNTFKALANFALSGLCPLTIIKHINLPNPYKSKYGDKYYDMIKNTKALSPFLSIRNLVLLMVSCANDALKDSVFYSNWVFYHAALYFMTLKEYWGWMKERKFKGKSLLDTCILPLNSLNNKKRAWPESSKQLTRIYASR